jgi:hypothetical protein
MFKFILWWWWWKRIDVEKSHRCEYGAASCDQVMSISKENENEQSSWNYILAGSHEYIGAATRCRDVDDAWNVALGCASVQRPASSPIG